MPFAKHNVLALGGLRNLKVVISMLQSKPAIILLITANSRFFAGVIYFKLLKTGQPVNTKRYRE